MRHTTITIALALLAVFCTASVAASTDAECTEHHTYLFSQPVSDTDSTTIATKLSECNLYASSDAVCNATCMSLTERMLTLTKAKNRMDCQDSRYYIHLPEIKCLKDDNGEKCGGLQGWLNHMGIVMNAFNQLFIPSSSVTNENLTKACSSTCNEKGTELIMKMYAGGNTTATSRAFKMISGLKPIVCRQLKGKLCYEDTAKSFQTLGKDDLTADKLDKGHCSLTNRCGKAGLQAFADFYTDLGKDKNDDSMCGGSLCRETYALFGELFNQYNKFMCLKHANDHYCMMLIVDEPTAPWGGDCFGVTGDTPECKAHLTRMTKKCGCCITSIMDMYRSIPQFVEMGSNYTEKMSEAKITEPTACSLDAFQIPIEFTLSGPTKDEAEAAKEDIKKDVGATFGQSTDLVEVEIKEVRRLIGRVGRVLAEKTVQVKAMVKTSSEADAKSIQGQAEDGVILPSTTQALESKGVGVKVSGSVKAEAPKKNPNPTGEVVVPFEKKLVTPGTTEFYIGAGGIVLIVLGVAFFLQSVYCVHKHRHILKKHFTEKFFNSIDADGNGTLDAGEIKIMLEHEFGACVSMPQVKRLMKKFGTTEMDFPTYQKFVEYLKGIDEGSDGVEMKEILEKKVWKRKSMVQLNVKDNGDREFVNPLSAQEPKRARGLSRNSWELKNAAKRAEKIKSDAVRKSTPSNVAVEVPPAWEKLFDATSGNNYFHNINTGETAWELPAGAKVRE